jgi:LysM repeat protein
MKKLKPYSLLIAICFATISVSAQRITTAEYIERHKEMAIQEMIRTGTPAAITLAQGVLETESGNSELVRKSNNHFGIKCKAEWTGDRVFHDDDESGECFRKYDSVVHSYRDHSDFLRTRAHYAFLYSLDPLDYKSWSYGLKKAGYATNPRYPQILIKTIETNNLNEYTKTALSQISDYQVFVLKKGQPVSNTSLIAVEDTQSITMPIDKAYTKVYNGIKAVHADSGTSLFAIATKFKIDLAKLLEYNDMIKDGLLDRPQWIYLQSKKKECKQAQYKVKTGESLHQISQDMGIQLSYLMAYNGLDNPDDFLPAGTMLNLRSSTQNSTGIEKKVDASDIKSTSKIRYHQVVTNENLNQIAQKYQVSIDELKTWNNLADEKILVGQRIIVSK